MFTRSVEVGDFFCYRFLGRLCRVVRTIAVVVVGAGSFIVAVPILYVVIVVNEAVADVAVCEYSS